MVVIHHLGGGDVVCFESASEVLLVNSTAEGEFELRKEVDCECG